MMPSLEDKLFLKEAKGGQFSMKLVYQSLNGYAMNPFPYRSIRNSWVPTKVGCFAWEAFWGKVLTLDQLTRRGIILANKRFLCEEEETIEHLSFALFDGQAIAEPLPCLFFYQ